MFNDYEVVGESSFGLLPEVIMGIIIVSLMIIVISLISMAIVFKKAGKPWWTALIPVYNIIVELELATMPQWTIILLFVPFVNIFIMLKAKMNLAESFNKRKEFGIGLGFLPFIFYPILAFGKSEYRGINNSAFETHAIDPNAMVKEITTEDIKKEEYKPQIPITTGTGESSSFKVPDELKAKPLPTLENPELPPQEVLAGFRVEKEEKPNFVLSEQDLPKEEENKQPAPTQKEITSIQDFYSSMKAEGKASAPMNPAQQIANQMSQIIPPVPNTNGIDEFVTCPKCNAKIKKGAPQCFLCGTKLDQ